MGAPEKEGKGTTDARDAGMSVLECLFVVQEPNR
jgi:hypothetical protein